MSGLDVERLRGGYEYLLAYSDGSGVLLAPHGRRTAVRTGGGAEARWKLAAAGWQYVGSYNGATMALYRRRPRPAAG